MSAWLQRFGAARQPRARLICFPHAGGAPGMFQPWRHGLPDDIELLAVQLPGRSARLREPAIASLPALTALVTQALSPCLDRPCAFFGHSMGAVLALEVAQALGKAGQPGPSHLFLSARRPPHLPVTEPDLHRLPDDAFLHELGTRYGGIPAEVLREPELLELLLPALRADIVALETHTPPPAAPVDCPITAYGGEDDRLVSLEQLRAWRGYTNGAFKVRQFRGGHFYLQSARDALLSDVGLALRPLVGTTATGPLAT